MNKIYLRATDGVVPSVKFEFLYSEKLKLIHETSITKFAIQEHD